MQILEHGNTYKKVKCPYCNAQLGIIKTDIKFERECSFGVYYDKEYVICPECGRRIIFKGIAYN